MNGNGYEEANRCYNQMSEEMRELAVQWGVDPDKLIGLWDIAVQIDVVGKPGAGTLVWKDRDEVYSTKPYNVFFRLNAYDQGIDEGELLDSLEISSKTVDELVQLHCIRLEEGKIYLVEKILIKDD